MKNVLGAAILAFCVACSATPDTDTSTSAPTTDPGAPTTSPAVTETAAPSTIEPLDTPEPTPTEEPFEDATSGPFAAVELVDFAFVPDRFVMLPEQGLELTNTGSALHNLSIADTPIDLDVDPGGSTQTEQVQNILPPGTYDFFCKYHRDQDMVGNLRVEEL